MMFRFRTLIITICLCLCQSPLSAYVTPSLWTVSQQQLFQRATSSSLTGKRYAAVSSREALEAGFCDNHLDPASRFHNDMKRVLQSRKQMQEDAATNSPSETILSMAPMERRKRPQILEEDIDGVIRVTAMLKHMVDIGVATEESFQIVLEAVGKRGRLRWVGKNNVVVCAADKADDLIRELWQRQHGRVSTRSCNLALKAYAACSTPRGHRNYAQKAQRLLDDMQEQDVTADAESYSHVINAWAWQQGNLEDSACAQMAQENLEKLLELSPNDETMLQAYDWILEAWSKSPSEDAPKQAERIIGEMKTLSRRSSVGTVLPNSQSYTNSILARAKSRSKNSAPKAHKLLMDYIESYENGELNEGSEPQLLEFNAVISAWARIERPDMAEVILWKANDLRRACRSLVPDVVTYNSVINSYLKHKDRSYGLQRILEIVSYMNGNSEEGPEIAPNCFTHHCLLKAWDKSDRADSAIHTVQAIESMHRMWAAGDKSLTPANAFYNMAINKIAKSKSALFARKAQDILRLLQSSEFCSPDIISYTSAIECYSKSKDPAAAEVSIELFEEVRQIYENKEDATMMPNLRTYTMVILSLTKNPILKHVVKARDLLVELNDLYAATNDPNLRPNAYPYNYVLNCAASCIGDADDKLKAFQIATSAFNELRKSDFAIPDSYTYSFWFKACISLLPESDLKEKAISYSFEQCKKEGLVSNEVVRRLKGAPNVLDIEPGTTTEDLPPSWSRNIR